VLSLPRHPLSTPWAPPSPLEGTLTPRTFFQKLRAFPHCKSPQLGSPPLLPTRCGSPPPSISLIFYYRWWLSAFGKCFFLAKGNLYCSSRPRVISLAPLLFCFVVVSKEDCLRIDPDVSPSEYGVFFLSPSLPLCFKGYLGPISWSFLSVKSLPLTHLTFSPLWPQMFSMVRADSFISFDLGVFAAFSVYSPPRNALGWFPPGIPVSYFPQMPESPGLIFMSGAFFSQTFGWLLVKFPSWTMGCIPKPSPPGLW